MPAALLAQVVADQSAKDMKLLDMLSAKSAEQSAKDKMVEDLVQKLSAANEKVQKLLEAVPVQQAQYEELKRRNRAALRAAGVLDVRDAVAYMFECMGGSTEERITTYFTEAPLGVMSLSCMNENRIIFLDYHKKPLQPNAAAKLLLAIQKRLNQDSHPKLTPEDYAREGTTLKLLRNGLGASDVEVLRCLFKTHAYPVEVQSTPEG